MALGDAFLTDPELLKRWPSKVMVPSPSAFDGTLEELYQRYIEPNLPRPETVAYYHRLLTDYCLLDDPLFIVRAVTHTERRIEYTTKAGLRFRPSDNAPAWWMHFVAFNDILIEERAFAQVLDTVPTHMFDVKKRLPTTINEAGWYVAHLFPVKDRDTAYLAWDRQNLVRRFIRNIHPCNHFYVPQTRGRDYGEDRRVIAYVAQRYECRYAPVWDEFLRLAQVDVPLRADVPGTFPYRYAARDQARPSRPIGVAASTSLGATTPAGDVGGVVEPKVTYRYGRLCFKAAAIEPLQPTDAFRVITDFGTFQMTKAEFYAHFPNVVASSAYQRSGLYNSAKPPTKALRFKID